MKTQVSRIPPVALAMAVLGLNLSATHQARAASFVSTSPMHNARADHTATLLPNGKVLVVGGDIAGGISSSAELYLPDSDGSAPFITILHQADQILSFSWTGVGTLEQSDSLTAPNWQPAPIQDNPQTLSTTGGMMFYRVKAD